METALKVMSGTELAAVVAGVAEGGTVAAAVEFVVLAVVVVGVAAIGGAAERAEFWAWVGAAARPIQAARRNKDFLPQFSLTTKCLAIMSCDISLKFGEWLAFRFDKQKGLSFKQVPPFHG